MPYFDFVATGGIRVSQTYYVLLFFSIKGYSYAFSLVSVGKLEMPGPVKVTYEDSIGIVQTGLRNMLLHWNTREFVFEIYKIGGA